LELQHEDGGWPTYGLDADSPESEQSRVDATTQVIRAIVTWRDRWRAQAPLNARAAGAISDDRITSALQNGLRYLESQQREDGSFVPRWFGNERQPENQNLVIGTSQALAACADAGALDTEMAQRAARWVVTAQHSTGGWGPPRAPMNYSGDEKDGFRAWRANESMAKYCSMEETAAAVSALLPLAAENNEFTQTCSRGLTWLINAVEQDAHRRPAVIGFYLPGLWYHERLYPLAYASQAFAQAARQLAGKRPATVPVS
jgi:squalene-hopene/tetraprenyl-beta-curcumene cyclase